MVNCSEFLPHFLSNFDSEFLQNTLRNITVDCGEFHHRLGLRKFVNYSIFADSLQVISTVDCGE